MDHDVDVIDDIALIRAEIERECDGYRRSRHIMREEMARQLRDPEVELFRNIRRLTVEEWDKFDTKNGELVDSYYSLTNSDNEMSNDDDTDATDADDSNGRRGKKKWRRRRRKKKKKKPTRKIRARVIKRYHIGRYKESNWYKEFLSTDSIETARHIGREMSVREMTHIVLSRNANSEFRAWFRMPLYKVEELVDRFITEEWVHCTHHCRTMDKLRLKTELLILGALTMLGGTMNSFRQLRTVTHICATDHINFFLLFVRRMWSIRDEYISLPRDEEELEQIMRRYEEVGLPGAMGSLDVVHVKWSSCPAGDFNRCKGKEGFPTLGFECITDYDRKIIGVFGPQFGTQNDKHIVKLDDNVAAVSNEWYSDVEYMRSVTNGRLEESFSANLESVRKDVECVFGILKTRWTSLDKGFKYRRIEICHCILHNMMLDEMVREPPTNRIGRGCRMPNDGMWLAGPTEPDQKKLNRLDKKLRSQFDARRTLLAHHLRVWKEKCKGMKHGGVVAV